MPLNPTIGNVCDFIKWNFVKRKLDFSNITTEQKVELESLAKLSQSIKFNSESPDF